MGLTVRDDPKKVVDIAGRTWGEAADGVALSLRLNPREDRDELPSVSVAIRNCGETPRVLRTRGWLNFFEVAVLDSAGASAELTSYGRELRKPDRGQALSEIELGPGKAMEADIPIGSIFRMKGRYRVQAFCETPDGGRAVSNEIEVNA
jgi:hypothetical protein